MRILVIGGTRFIGRAIVERLLHDGHQLTLLNRGLTSDPFGTSVRRVVGDRREREVIERAAARCDWDVVVDVTAYNEQQTRMMVEAFRERTGHLIHISTASVYLVRPDRLPPYREEDAAGLLPHPTDRSDPGWLYGLHKRRCEIILEQAWEEHRLPFTALRLPMVVGEHDYTRRTHAYLERLASGGPLILPDGGRNSWGFLWVEDAATTVAANLANTSTFGRAYNLAAREIISLAQLVEVMLGALGREAPTVSVPRQWLDSLGLGTGFSPYTVDRDVVLDCRAAEDDLLFRSTPMRHWVERLVRAFTARWDGILRAFAATREQELTLVRELSRLRLPSFAPEVVRAGPRVIGGGSR